MCFSVFYSCLFIFEQLETNLYSSVSFARQHVGEKQISEFMCRNYTLRINRWSVNAAEKHSRTGSSSFDVIYRCWLYLFVVNLLGQASGISFSMSIYVFRYSYKLHSKTHEGEKCYKCDLCPYASISARHLESHMLIHTDQKPYQCDSCYQSFRQKQLLKRHCNLYHNPSYVPPPPQEKTHQCPECERPFR